MNELNALTTMLLLFAVQNRVNLLFSRDELKKCAKEKTILIEIVRKYVDTLAGIPELLRE